MNSDHLDDLKDALSQKLLGTPWDSSGHTEVHAHVRALASSLRDYDSGESSMNRVRALFDRHPVPGFELGDWLQQQVRLGVYDETVFEDDPEED